MPLRLKEDPKEWRKSTLLTALALAVLVSFLRWRRILLPSIWLTVLVLLAGLALAACLKPWWFRSFYRLSTRLGFYLSHVLARVILALMFVLFITPLGLILRLLGKDPLRLKRPINSGSYWTPAKPASPLERMF